MCNHPDCPSVPDCDIQATMNPFGEEPPVAAVAYHTHVYSRISVNYEKYRKDTGVGSAIEAYCMDNNVQHARLTFTKPIYPDLEAPSVTLSGNIDRPIPNHMGAGDEIQVPFSTTFVGCFCKAEDSINNSGESPF